jgi:hypothetical protein
MLSIVVGLSVVHWYWYIAACPLSFVDCCCLLFLDVSCRLIVVARSLVLVHTGSRLPIVGCWLWYGCCCRLSVVRSQESGVSCRLIVVARSLVLVHTGSRLPIVGCWLWYGCCCRLSVVRSQLHVVVGCSLVLVHFFGSSLVLALCRLPIVG